jgi:RNA polymerase sigma-B factor
MRARERLVELYMPLVEGLARRHGRRNAEHDDLVQAGSIGLLNAIERFDPKRGEEFLAFAVPTIAGEIRHHIRDRSATVRLPRRLHDANTRLPRARQDLTTRLGRGPTSAELASELGVSAEDLARLESTTTSSQKEAVAETDAGELGASEARLLLAGAFRTLDDTDRTILYLRFVRERSRREVADELGMSQSALARRTTAALAKLRSELEAKGFEQAGGPPQGAPETPPTEPAAAPPPAEAAHAPEVKVRAGYSGRLMLRMPQSLHAELAEAAEREEVSLNQFITNTLSAAMHWRSQGEAAAPAPRWLPAAIVTNVVVVVIAGVIAVILLIIAWQHGW